jgi:outer membrane usher protein
MVRLALGGICDRYTHGECTSEGRRGVAAAAGFRLAQSGTDAPTDVDLLWRFRSANYRTLGEAVVLNDVAHEVSASVRQLLPLDISASAGFSYVTSRSRSSQPRFSASAGRAFHRIFTNIFFDRGRSLDGRLETSVVAALSMRINGRSSVRAQYRSRTNERVVEFDRTSSNAVGEGSARTGYSNSHSGSSLQGTFDLTTNRGELGLRSGLTEVGTSGDRVIDTTLRGAFGIAFAGGKIAIGRPVYEGFAIVSRHRTLGRNRVTVPAGLGGRRNLASTDFLGPALLPLSRAYQAQKFDVAVHDLPVGYDAGSSRIAVLPGARSGIAVTIGSDAVNSVLGSLVYPDGEPVELASGMLRRFGDKDVVDQPFFTNRTGRFAAERLRPGTYAILIAGADTGAKIVIPEDANGLVRAGRIVVTRR